MIDLPCDPKDITCTVAADGKSITFHPCGFTSYNTNDVEKRYCARCHRWMDLVELARELIADAKRAHRSGKKN